MAIKRKTKKIKSNKPNDVAIKSRSSLAIRETLAGYAFLFPMFSITLIFVVFPIIFSLILSFSDFDIMQGFSSLDFVGLKHFKSIFNDNWFTDSMKNSLIFSVTTVPIGIAFGLVLAAVINDYVYFPSLHKISLFIPYISSAIASAVVWSVILHPSYGPVNEFLRFLGVSDPPGWFTDFDWALPSVIVFSIWQQMGYIVLVYMSGINGVPQELYESADIDGAGGIRKFFHITIPMVSPSTFFLLVMGLIQSFRVFDIISALTEGGPGTSTTVIAYYIYREAFRYYEMGKASAAAWIMFIIIFAITIYQWRQQTKWDSFDI